MKNRLSDGNTNNEGRNDSRSQRGNRNRRGGNTDKSATSENSKDNNNDCVRDGAQATRKRAPPSEGNEGPTPLEVEGGQDSHPSKKQATTNENAANDREKEKEKETAVTSDIRQADFSAAQWTMLTSCGFNDRTVLQAFANVQKLEKKTEESYPEFALRAAKLKKSLSLFAAPSRKGNGTFFLLSLGGNTNIYAADCISVH
jgi:hypothetical protein